jgi:hypothetical protein
MAHPSEHLAIYVITAVGALALGLTVLAIRAWNRSRSPRMLYLAGAFSVLALKGLVTAGALWQHRIGHETLELLGSLFDLVVVLLLIAPVIHR